MSINKKEQKDRLMSFDSLPPAVKDSLTEEEKQLFLTAEEWPESLFKKLEEFIVRKPE